MIQKLGEAEIVCLKVTALSMAVEKGPQGHRYTPIGRSNAENVQRPLNLLVGPLELCTFRIHGKIARKQRRVRETS